MINNKEYSDFVDSITTKTGKDDDLCLLRLAELSHQTNGNFARLDLGITGLAGEAGEVADLWKKLKYHNKPFDTDMKNRIIEELGDVFWYLSQISIGLGVSFDEIMQKNQEKLKSRHQNGLCMDKR